MGLYEEAEKPENPLEFIKQYLGGPAEVDIEALRQENEEVKKKNVELVERIEQLTKQCTTFLHAHTSLANADHFN